MRLEIPGIELGWRGLGIDYEGGVLDHPARVAIHFVHRLGAIVTAIVLAWLAIQAWRKGRNASVRIAGAVVGILFPPALLSSSIVGAAGGGVIARLNRSLDRGDIKDLGEVMDAGEIVLVLITSEATAQAATDLLSGAKRSVTKASSTAEEVREAMGAEG